MLTSKQKAYLKSLAHKLEYTYQLGKNEITPELLDMLSKALLANELVKIHVLKASLTPIRETALDLAGALRADIVQIIGRHVVLYKPNLKDRKIKLPQ
ncbi:MAG TPA: YhbY family RNA-binding protein [Bacilli bacterium]|nr:YhbY family RNA-binding protein [Bacilli bacterium]